MLIAKMIFHQLVGIFVCNLFFLKNNAIFSASSKRMKMRQTLVMLLKVLLEGTQVLEWERRIYIRQSHAAF